MGPFRLDFGKGEAWLGFQPHKFIGRGDAASSLGVMFRRAVKIGNGMSWAMDDNILSHEQYTKQ